MREFQAHVTSGSLVGMAMAKPPEGIEVLPDNPDELFTLIERVGAGGSGCTVFRAQNNVTKEIVGIKTVPLSITDAEIEDVRKEIQMLRHCDHPNVVMYRGTYWTPGMLWVCMEFCAGGSVEKLFDAGQTISEAGIAYVCHEVLLGLQYLHSHRIIHRDVKGSNVLVTESGGVKLADFGVSAQLLNTLSRRNSTVGTYYWMAPEAITGKDYDERADIWSLGITVIEMAQGKPPCSDLSPIAVMFHIPRAPPPTLRDSAAWTPLMHNFLARCLVKDFSHRPSAAQLLQDPFIVEAQNMADELGAAARNAQLKRAEMGDDNASLVHVADNDTVASGNGEKSVASGSEDDEGTMIQREVQKPADPARWLQAGVESTLLDLPVIQLDEMGLDELTGDDGSPDFSVTSVLQNEVVDLQILSRVPHLTHTSQVLIRCMHHHKTAAQQRGLTDAEKRRHEQLYQRYSHIVRSTLGV
jgi:serine/threonine protein kinase